MGHIKTHAEISVHVTRQLEAILPGINLVYIELGNFITDIAQFRDPYAYIRAKGRIWNTALADGGLRALAVQLGLGSVRPWLDDLMGRAEKGRRHGALADFFEQIALFFTHQFFANDSPIALKLLVDETLTTHSSFKPLPPFEVDRVFKWAFTQYYPHEHVDFPPEGEGPNHRSHVLFQTASRKLLRYLEEQLQFISEELSKIEHQWVLNRTLPATDPVRCDLLVRLGHILHAVEDFYFHSNTVEVKQWHRLLKLYPQRQPYQKDADYQFLVSNILQGTRHQSYQAEVKTRLARRLGRRLRYPIFVRDTEGDQGASEDATNLIYTGGFGQTDMFHTMHGALEAIEEVLERPHPHGDDTGQRIRQSDLVLIKTLFNEQERRDMVEDEQYKNFKVQEHQHQLISQQYRQWIEQMRVQGKITARGESALFSAFQEDRILEDRYPGIAGTNIPGVGGFLINFLALLQAEVDRSSQKAKELDAKPESVFDWATTNGASEEMIGTHSLMAKDSDKKEPLREEAMALAKFASAAIAIILVRRIQNDSDPDHGLDWDTIVRHFVRFPPDRADSWEEEVLAALSGGGNLPTLDTIQDKPNYRMLTVSDKDGKLRERRDGDKTSVLEARYHQREYDYDW